MGDLIAFAVERLIVSTPDLVIAGLGGYLIGRGPGRTRGAGLAISTLYALAIVGTLMGPGGQADLAGPVCGVVSAGLMLWLSRRKRTRAPTATPGQ